MASYNGKVSLTRVYPHARPEEPLPRGYSDMTTVVVLLLAWILALPITLILVEVIKHFNR